MTARKQGFLYLILSILFVLFGYEVNQFIQVKPKMPLDQFSEITVLSKPRDLPEVMLHAIDKDLQINAKQDQWTWLFFGFTHCQQLCPTTLQQMNEAYTRLEKLRLKSLPNVFMVSIDPLRETIDTVENYTQSFNGHFHGLTTASQTDLDLLTKTLGLVYIKEALDQKSGITENNYTINHSGTIIILNPAGQVAGFFNTPHNPKKMATEYRAWVG